VRHPKPDRRITDEFVDELALRAERFKRKLHQAFVSWYVEAYFGGTGWDFIDDAGDGGIDAIVWRPDDIPPVVLMQSKFTERIGGPLLGKAAYRDFRKVVEAFYYGEEAFDGLLAGARADVRSKYRRAFDRLRDAGTWAQQKKAFRLVTTCRRRAGAASDWVPPENYVYADDVLKLYREYRKGATPRARPLELHVRDKLSYTDPKRGVTSYLFNAQLSDFRRYLDRSDVARLVARNIRYNLGGRVGRDIAETYERRPHDFWYLHNGITVICDEFLERNQVATLVNPSVVNGAQTLYAISSSPRRESLALVPTRVVVREPKDGKPPEDDEWLQSVIRGVNTQNRVRAYDLRSNEPEQLELQKRFRETKVFYERKRGEWREVRNEAQYRDFARVSLRTLGQILTVTADRSGKGVLQVKRSVEGIFDEKPYRRLFPSRAKVARRFERIYLAYRAYRLASEYAYGTASEWRKQRHGFWHVVWLFHRGISSYPRLHTHASLRTVRDAFDAFEDRGAVGRRARKVVKQVRKAVWQAWRSARRADTERWTPNNFFKAKFGNRKVLSLALPKVRAALRSLAAHMAGR